LLEDVYDVPDKIYMWRDVPLTPEQKRMYKELRDFMTAEIADGQFVTATMKMTNVLRLHQLLCGHTVDEDGQEHEIPENRTSAILSILEDYDGKAIIWCSYDKDIRKVAEALAKEYGEAAVARYWGGNRATREDEERRFKTDPACLYMVATAAAGGRGHDWSVANLTIYHSSTPNLDDRDQSERRMDKVDKATKGTFIDIRARGTIDEKYILMLREKIDLAAAVTGDGYREWLI
jgi:hypothetical protein